MKVSNPTSSGLKESGKAIATTDVKENRKSSRSKPSEAVPGSEKVAISREAKEASQAKVIAKSAPDVNEEKVARIKAQMNSGKYSVDSDKIADRMVDEHLATAF